MGRFLPAVEANVPGLDPEEVPLPKDVRDRFRTEYRIVELPRRVALFPVDGDPLEGLRAAVCDAFAETDADRLMEDWIEN